MSRKTLVVQTSFFLNFEPGEYIIHITYLIIKPKKNLELENVFLKRAKTCVRGQKLRPWSLQDRRASRTRVAATEVRIPRVARKCPVDSGRALNGLSSLCSGPQRALAVAPVPPYQGVRWVSPSSWVLRRQGSRHSCGQKQPPPASPRPPLASLPMLRQSGKNGRGPSLWNRMGWKGVSGWELLPRGTHLTPFLGLCTYTTTRDF